MILILILTACRLPLYDAFYEPTTEQILLYDMSGDKTMQLNIDLLKEQPGYEVDISHYLKMDCA